MKNNAEVPEPATSPGEFNLARVLSVATGHFIHDSYPAFLSPVLPILIEKFGLTLGAAGALAAILRWSSLIQPFVGHLADRSDIRYFVVAAPTVTALGMSLIGVAPNYLAVVLLLILTGFSHAAFHPAASAMVTQASGNTWGRGLSIFMAGGELGRALGPLLIASITVSLGFQWSPIAVVLGVIASTILYFQVGRAPRAVAAAVSGSTFWQAVKRQWRPLGLLAGMVLFRSLAATSFATFLPTYYTGEGKGLLFSSAAITVYELAGAAGAFFGGSISDRVGRRRVLWVSQLLSVPFFWAVLSMEAPWSFVALIFAGLIALSTGPVNLALAQEIFQISERPPAASSFSSVLKEPSYRPSFSATPRTSSVWNARSTEASCSRCCHWRLPFIYPITGTAPQTNLAVRVIPNLLLRTAKVLLRL